MRSFSEHPPACLASLLLLLLLNATARWVHRRERLGEYLQDGKIWRGAVGLASCRRRRQQHRHELSAAPPPPPLQREPSSCALLTCHCRAQPGPAPPHAAPGARPSRRAPALWPILRGRPSNTLRGCNCVEDAEQGPAAAQGLLFKLKIRMSAN